MQTLDLSHSSKISKSPSSPKPPVKSNISQKLGNYLNHLRKGAANALLFSITKLVPRSRDIWIFGSEGGVFSGNSKYLFLWVAANRPDLKAVWLGSDPSVCRVIRNRGLTAYHRRSISGLWATLRARVVCYSNLLTDVNGALTHGALLVNLWHGVGLKPIMFGQESNGLPGLMRRWSNSVGKVLFYHLLKMPDILVTTSNFMQRHFSEQFHLPIDRCPQLGYPRLDCASDARLKQTAVGLDGDLGFIFNEEGFAETYIYMPTWRDTHRPFLEESLPDLGRLNHLLEKRNAVLYIKTHQWSKDRVGDTYQNIRIWPKHIDPSTYFDRMSGLITDYSSVLYDYLFLRDDGAILYTYDMATYMTEERALLYPFEENTAGLRVDSFEALCAALETGQVREPCIKAAAIREKFWGGSAAPASAAIVNYVNQTLGGV